MRHQIRWLSVGLVIAINGCAIGSYGLLAAKVRVHGDVATIATQSIGLQLRTRADDRGAHFGYSNRTYVVPRDQAPRVSPGWYLFRIPDVPAPALSVQSSTYGIEWSLNEPVAGISIGYAYTDIFARLPLDGSMLYMIDNRHGEVVSYTYCVGGEKCAQ